MESLPENDSSPPLEEPAPPPLPPTEQEEEAEKDDTASTTTTTTPAPWEMVPREGWRLLNQVKDVPWKAMYLLLAQFRKVHGHVNVTANQDGNDGDYHHLHHWIKEQRFTLYRKFTGMFEGTTAMMQTLSVEERQVIFIQLELLRLLGVVFPKSKSSRESSSSGAAQATPTMAPQDSSNNNNNNNTPSQQQQQSKTALKRKADWDTNLTKIREFRDEYGHTDVTNDVGLRRWVERQRKRLKGTEQKAAPLEPDQIQRLQDVGVFSKKEMKQKLQEQPDGGLALSSSAAPKTLKDPDVFEQKFAEMKEFHRQHGHTIVPDRHPLRPFLVDVRREYKKMNATGGASLYLTPARMERLQQINFSFVARIKLTFEERLAQWVEYRQQSGGKNPSSRSTLGKWTCQIRGRYHDTKDGKQVSYRDAKQHYLTDEQIAKLRAANFDFGERDYNRVVKSWDERFLELLEYKEEHGHVNVPQRYPGLGEWVHHQRSRRKKLVQEKKDKLEALGFQWLTRGAPTKRDTPAAKKPESEEESSSSEEEEDEEPAQPYHAEPAVQQPYYFHPQQQQQQQQQQQVQRTQTRRSPQRHIAGFSSGRRWI